MSGFEGAVHRVGADDGLFALLSPSLVPFEPPILERGPGGPLPVHGNSRWVSARGNCSNVHSAGALSGRQRTSLVPWRKRSAVM